MQVRLYNFVSENSTEDHFDASCDSAEKAFFDTLQLSSNRYHSSSTQDFLLKCLLQHSDDDRAGLYCPIDEKQYTNTIMKVINVKYMLCFLALTNRKHST